MEPFSNVKTITSATTTPISLAEAKAHCVVEHSDDDTLITGMISAATEFVEWWTRRSLVQTQKRIYLGQWSDRIFLPFGPVQSITKIQYIDTDGATQTVNTSPVTYELDPTEPFVLRAYGSTWPAARAWPNSIWIDYWVGYTDDTVSPVLDTSSIPERMKMPIYYLVSEMYKNRESALEIQHYANTTFSHLAQSARIYE